MSVLLRRICEGGREGESLLASIHDCSRAGTSWEEELKTAPLPSCFPLTFLMLERSLRGGEVGLPKSYEESCEERFLSELVLPPS
jgi:hypothetical protein